MSQIVQQLQNDLLICLSSNAYYLNLIEGDQTVYRIDSQEKIIFFKEVTLEKVIQIKGVKSTAKFVFVVNRRLQWHIFMIQRQQELMSLLWGKIPSEQDKYHQSNSSTPLEVVQIHQLNGLLMLILSDLRIYQLIITQKVRIQLSSIIQRKIKCKNVQPIHINLTLLYPPNSNHFLTQLYLPSSNTNIVTHSIAFESSSNVGLKKLTCFFLVFKPKNIKNSSLQQSQNLDCIYTINFNPDSKTFLSGEQCILSIPNQIIGLYQIGSYNIPQLLVQTSKQFYFWNHLSNSMDKTFQKFTQHNFLSHLTLFSNTQDSLSYIGCSLSSNQNQIESKEVKFVHISHSQKKGLSFEVLSKLNFNKVKPLLYLRNSIKQDNSYLFYENYSVSKVKNFKRQLSETAIFQDNSTFTNFAKVLFIEPMTNILLIQKNTQFSSEKVIVTNTFLQTERSQYQHNLPLTTAKVKFQTTNSKSHTIVLTSPVIGTLFLKIGKTEIDKIMIQPDDYYKSFTGHQCLQISQSRKTFINGHLITFSTQANKLGKFPSVTVSKIFENSTDYIESAIMFQKSQIFLLSLDDQIHVFEGNSEKSFKRKFIHCCTSNIKKMIKLNDVNVFAIEVYEAHNQSQSHGDELEVCYFEIYVLREDKFTRLNKVHYRKQFNNSDHLSFLSHINTVPHYFNLVWGQVVIVSSQQTHRYNPEKVQIQIYPCPNPLPSCQTFILIPLINLSIEAKNNTQHQFLLYTKEPNSNSIKLFTANFCKKFLVKSFNQIKFNYEAITLQSDCLEGKPLFSSVQTDTIISTKRTRKLMIYTTKRCYDIRLNSGKISLLDCTPTFSHYLDSLFGNTFLDDFNQFQGLQKIQAPFKIYKKQGGSNFIPKISQNYPISQNLLIHNHFQLWYATFDYKNKKFTPISVYTMVNNDFLQFRNNLSVEELDEPEFIQIFSVKLPIVQVKYLSDNCIIVLFQKQIVILEIGQNNSLTVRQEIIFSKAKKQNVEEIEGNGNEYSSIKIVELLDKASENNIFLKDVEDRLYVLSLDEKSKVYELKFDRNLEEDIVYVGRVKKWQDQKMTMILTDMSKDQNLKEDMQRGEQLIIKKDGQMILKDLKTKKQKAHYI